MPTSCGMISVVKAKLYKRRSVEVDVHHIRNVHERLHSTDAQ
jgi:hypothetical protein